MVSTAKGKTSLSKKKFSSISVVERYILGTFEQRKLIRADTVVKVIYKTIGKSQLEGLTFSRNVSTTGICIIVDKKLSKDTEIELQVYLSHKEPPIIAKGKIVWQVKCLYIPTSKKQYYSVGVLFTDMSTDHAIAASDFVKDVLREQSDVQMQALIEKIESQKTPPPKD